MFLVVSEATLSRGSRRPKASLNCFRGLYNELAELLLEVFSFFGGMARNKGLQCHHARPWVAHGNAWGQVWIGHGSGMDQGMDRNPHNPCAAGSTLQQHESWKDNRPVTNQQGWNCLQGHRV